MARRENELQARIDSLRKVSNNSNDSSNTKFIVIHISTLEPFVETNEFSGDQVVIWKARNYFSRIYEITVGNEDEKSKIVDGFILSTKNGLKWVLTGDRQSVAKITHRKVLEFDTYSQASSFKYDSEISD